MGQQLPADVSVCITLRGERGSCHNGNPNTLIIGAPTSHVSEWYGVCIAPPTKENHQIY